MFNDDISISSPPRGYFLHAWLYNSCILNSSGWFALFPPPPSLGDPAWWRCKCGGPTAESGKRNRRRTEEQRFSVVKTNEIRRLECWRWSTPFPTWMEERGRNVWFVPWWWKLVQYCKKRLMIFPSPTGMSLTILSLAGKIHSLFFAVWKGGPFLLSWQELLSCGLLAMPAAEVSVLKAPSSFKSRMAGRGQLSNQPTLSSLW